MSSGKTVLFPMDPSIPPYGTPGYFDLRVLLAKPPLGVIPNFNAPNPNGAAYIALSIIFLSTAIVFTVMRMYTKLVLTRSTGWDDCQYVRFSHWVLSESNVGWPFQIRAY